MSLKMFIFILNFYNFKIYFKKVLKINNRFTKKYHLLADSLFLSTMHLKL